MSTARSFIAGNGSPALLYSSQKRKTKKDKKLVTTSKHVLCTNRKASHVYHTLYSYRLPSLVSVLHLAANLSRASRLRLAEGLGGAS